MTNKQVTKEYVKLKHSIASCTNQSQLETLYNLVQSHVVRHNHENDLMGIYLIKSGSLMPDFIYPEDEILNIHHSKLSAK